MTERSVTKFSNVLAAIRERERRIRAYERPMIKAMVEDCPLTERTPKGVVDLLKRLQAFKRELTRQKYLAPSAAFREARPYTLKQLIDRHPAFKDPDVRKLGDAAVKYGLKRLEALRTDP